MPAVFWAQAARERHEAGGTTPKLPKICEFFARSVGGAFCESHVRGL
jgi:hypothetical protein